MNGSTSVRDTVRQIALTVTFSAIGWLIPYLVEELLQLELSKITVAIIAFAFSALGAIILLPLPRRPAVLRIESRKRAL